MCFFSPEFAKISQEKRRSNYEQHFPKMSGTFIISLSDSFGLTKVIKIPLLYPVYCTTPQAFCFKIFILFK